MFSLNVCSLKTSSCFLNSSALLSLWWTESGLFSQPNSQMYFPLIWYCTLLLRSVCWLSFLNPGSVFLSKKANLTIAQIAQFKEVRPLLFINQVISYHTANYSNKQPSWWLIYNVLWASFAFCSSLLFSLWISKTISMWSNPSSATSFLLSQLQELLERLLEFSCFVNVSD